MGRHRCMKYRCMLSWSRLAVLVEHVIRFFLNSLGLATTANAVVRTPNKEPQTIADALNHNWMNWALTPAHAVTAKRYAYYTDFQDMLTVLGIKHRLIPTDTP